MGGGCIIIGELNKGKEIVQEDIDNINFQDELEPRVLGGLGEKKSNGGTQWYLQDRIYDDNIATSVCTSFNPYYKAEEVVEESSVEDYYLSDKGKAYVLNPKRGMCTDINADVAQTLTAKGQQNWTGSFISPEIESIEKSTEIGSTTPVQIHLKNGETISSADKGNSVKYRIRKFTERECFRLMGVKNEDYDLLQKDQSASSQYHLAGDSIVTTCLMAIFGELLDIDYKTKILEVEKNISNNLQKTIDK